MSRDQVTKLATTHNSCLISGCDTTCTRRYRSMSMPALISSRRTYRARGGQPVRGCGLRCGFGCGCQSNPAGTPGPWMMDARGIGIGMPAHGVREGHETSSSYRPTTLPWATPRAHARHEDKYLVVELDAAPAAWPGTRTSRRARSTRTRMRIRRASLGWLGAGIREDTNTRLIHILEV